MAKLTDPSTPERPVPKLIGPERFHQLQGPSDAPGRAMADFGEQLGKGGEELFRAQQVEENRVNHLRAEEAFTNLRAQQLDLSIGEQNGFTKLRGGAAVSRPILTEWGKRFQDVQTGITQTLSNDEQRKLFATRANTARLTFDEEILRHLAREGDTYAKEVYDGTIAQAQRDAVARWDSPNDIQVSLLGIENAVSERSERYGWAKPYRDATLRQEQGKVHAAVVQQAIASNNYLYAQEWFNQHKADIDLATAKLLEKAVEDGTQKDLANGYRSEYLANEENSSALEGLRKRVLGDKTLDDARRNVLVGTIQNQQFRLEHRAEAEHTRVMKTLERGINELNSNTLAGFEPTPDQFAPFITATKGTELEPALQAAIATASATRMFRNQAPAMQERLLAEAEAGVRNDPTKFDRKVVAAWRTVYENQQRTLKENPVLFAVQQGLARPPAPLDLSNPQQAGPALQERFSIARGMESTHNAPFKPLTEQETNLMRAVLKGAPADAKRNWFSGLAQAAGNDYKGYSAVMSQLAPDDPVTAVAGLYAYRGRQAASDLMLRGQAILNPVRTQDGKPDQGKLWPMPPDADLRKEFKSYERDAFAGRPEVRNDFEQAAKAIYAAKSAEEGDASGVINTSRWQESIKLATGGIEKYRGKFVVMPYGHSYSQFTDGIAQRVDSMIERGQLAPDMRDKVMNLPVEAMADGKYVFRAGDGVLVATPAGGKQPRPVVIDFNEGVPYRFSGQAAAGVAPPTDAELAASAKPVTGRTSPLTKKKP